MGKILETLKDPIFAFMVVCVFLISSMMYSIYKYWDYHHDLKDQGIILIWDPGTIGQYKPHDVNGVELKPKQ